jgi:phosphate transport system permease protein
VKPVSNIKDLLKRRHRQERWVTAALMVATSVTVFTTLGIVGILLTESYRFFQQVSLWDFLSDSQWTPLFSDPRFGIAVLLSGTITSAVVALLFAIPIGTLIAIYLAEYASHRVREACKPVLELLSAVPTIVYGFFALLFITPLLQKLLPNLPGFNLLSAGIAIGIMLIPTIASLAEDALRSVPMSLREASYAMGATRMTTSIKVVYPAALSGIAAAYILAMSRAVGETMIVAVAGGLQPNLSFNPMESAATMTAFIVQVALGDLPHGSLGYQTIFAVGLTLFLVTLVFNLLGFALRQRYRNLAGAGL